MTSTISEKEITLLEKNLQRIFCMTIKRTTFHEVQNVVFSCANGDKPLAQRIFETLVNGEMTLGPVPKTVKESMEGIIARYSIPIRLSKQVYEKGDFISAITSDLLKQPEGTLFNNRIRRVDGEEFQFISDADSTIHLLYHFLGRLRDVEKEDNGEFIKKHQLALADIREKIDQLIK